MNYALSIARRLYSTKDDNERISSLGVNIASVGVAIGLLVMIASVCVVLGFKGEIRSKVIGFGGHIQMVNGDALRDPQAYPLIASDSLMRRLGSAPGICHIQRVSQKAGILKTDEDFKGIVLKGVDADFDTTFLASNIIEGRLPDFASDESAQHIVISNIMASQLQLHAGDKVYAYFFDREVRMRRYVVDAVYETNMTQFDNTVVYASRASVNKLSGWNDDDCTTLEITVNDFDRNEETADLLAQYKPATPDKNGCYYAIYSIRELYNSIFDWLNLLDLNVWVILILMAFVCGFTIISGLFILILEKTQTIGILKTLGARNNTVRKVFLYYGVFIIARGMVLGNALALLLCWLQHRFHLLSLDASSYYVDHVPVAFNWLAILAVNAATLVLCTLILVIPTMVVSRIKPIKSLKFD